MLMDLNALQKIAKTEGRSPRGLSAWRVVAHQMFLAAGGLDLVARLSFLEGMFGVRPNSWAGRGANKALQEILKSEAVTRRGMTEQQVKDLLAPWLAPGDTGIISNIRRAITPILKGVGIEPDDLIMPALAGLDIGGGEKKPVFYSAGTGSFFDLNKFLDGQIKVSQVAKAATGYMKRRALDAKSKELTKLKQQQRIDRGTPSHPDITKDVPSFSDLSTAEQADLIAIALMDTGNPLFRPVQKEFAKLLSQVSTPREREIFSALLEAQRTGKSSKQIAEDLGVSPAAVSQTKRKIGDKVRKGLAAKPDIFDPILRKLDISRLGLGRGLGRFAKKLTIEGLVKAYRARVAA